MKQTSQRSSVNLNTTENAIIMKSKQLSKNYRNNAMISFVFLLNYSPAADFNAAALSVASQVNSGSSRPK